MEQQVFEGTWEEIAIHADQLSGRRIRVTVLNDEGTLTLDQTLLDLLQAAEVLESQRQQEAPFNPTEDTGKAFTDIVLEKYKKQGFNL